MFHVIDCLLDHEKQQAFNLIKKEGLFIDDKITLTLGFMDGNHMFATGSLYHNVIKMIAVDTHYRGENLTAYVVSILIQRLLEQGITKYFIFTNPINKHYFMQLNFSLIIENPWVVMLENNVDTIVEHLQRIKKTLPKMRGSIGSIVMNCNPVTNGHMYLIEHACRHEDYVILFLVEENKSVFTFETRLKLLKEATKHLSNLFIVPSTAYIISSATFPTYFLKENTDTNSLYMALDLSIFKNYFMPILGISKRYTGTEPLDPLTQLYNQSMHEILNDAWQSIERIKCDEEVISASYVRKLAKEQNYDKIKTLVPLATYQFLLSKEGKALFNHE